MSKTSIINDYVAGGIGGCAGIIVGHPLDTVKVQLQTQEYGGKYTGIMDCIRTVQSQNLTKGYLRGLSWPLISYSYLNAVFFGSYGLILKKWDYVEEECQKPNFTIFAAACISTVPQLMFSCPVEVIKVTLQSQIPHTHDVPKSQVTRYYNGPLEAVKSIVKSSGVRGMYRGFLTQCVRDSPANGLYMITYTFFQYGGQGFASIPSQLVNFIGGGVAGVVSWMSIMPLDVVKSKLQADTEGKMYKGFWDCARHLYKANGIRAFFVGTLPVALRAFPVNAVTLGVYSETLIYLKKIEHIED